MCECQSLHPDPEDDDSDSDFEGEEYDMEEAGKENLIQMHNIIYSQVNEYLEYLAHNYFTFASFHHSGFEIRQ